MIDKNNPIPKYWQLRDILEGYILSNGLKENDVIYSEPALVKKYGVSLTTVRKCIQEMVYGGILYREHGRGTFVKDSSLIDVKRQNKKSKLAGLIVPTISGHFFPVLAKGVEDTAHKQGYNIIFGNSENSTSKEERYIENLSNKNIEGIIIAPGYGSNKNSLIKSTKDKISIIVVDGTKIGGIKLPHVITDDEKGAFEAVSYLIQLGHKRIAHITGQPNSYTARMRERGYRKALIHHKIDIDEKLIKHGDVDEEKDGYKISRYFMNLQDRPTAVFAFNDTVACGVVQYILSVNLKVPQDISVLGYGNTIQHMSGIELTTVNQPAYEIGGKAFSLLVDRMSGNNKLADSIRLSVRLIIRNSCR